MGNFHCIPSTCAKVVYREYLPPVVRWRYEGEEWQEIEADNYTIEETEDLSKPTRYILASREARVRNGQFQEWTDEFIPSYGGDYYDGIFSWRLRFLQNGQNFYTSQNKYTNYPENGAYVHRTEIFNIYLEIIDSLGNYHETFVGRTYTGYWGTRIVVAEVNQRKTNCEFKIFKGNSVVYQETREICPEVEKLDCRLSDEFKEIEIDKLSYLQRVEVRNQSVNTIYIPPLDAPFLDIESLSNECLNIYNTVVTAPPFLSDYVLLPGVVNPYIFIAQICSASDCPPPKYEMICNCDCIECPINTCAVQCDGHVCCYDTDTGISVKSIAMADYCGSSHYELS